MYQILIKRHLRNQFDRLNVGDYESVLRGVDDHVHHRFAGQHPLGRERHSKEALRLWFQRLFRLYRNLEFEVHHITLTGWPWDLRAAADIDGSDAAETRLGQSSTLPCLSVRSGSTLVCWPG